MSFSLVHQPSNVGLSETSLPHHTISRLIIFGRMWIFVLAYTKSKGFGWGYSNISMDHVIFGKQKTINSSTTLIAHLLISYISPVRNLRSRVWPIAQRQHVLSSGIPPKLSTAIFHLLYWWVLEKRRSHKWRRMGFGASRLYNRSITDPRKSTGYISPLFGDAWTTLDHV